MAGVSWKIQDAAAHKVGVGYGGCDFSAKCYGVHGKVCQEWQAAIPKRAALAWPAVAHQNDPREEAECQLESQKRSHCVSAAD